MCSDKMIRDLVDVLKDVAIGRCSIALAGSRAKDDYDEDSDIDLYMLIDKAKPRDEIYNIISAIADKTSGVSVSGSFDAAPYGGSIDFYYNGIPVETTVKYFSNIKRRIDECLDGHFEIIPQTWTSNGYYTYICLSEISAIKPVFETDGFIKEQKRRTQQYPEALRKTILGCFMARACTWMNNFHYDSAINRADYMFCAPIVLHTVFDLIQVIFAINRVYFFGDKRLEKALLALPYCPASLTDNLLFLMQSSTDIEQLQKQHEILKGIIEELNKKIDDEK